MIIFILFFVLPCSLLHSVRKDFIGLAMAAFMAWKLTVNNAISNTTIFIRFINSLRSQGFYRVRNCRSNCLETDCKQCNQRRH